jgi:hypothetical protein
MITEAELHDLVDRCARSFVEFESACQEILSDDHSDAAACERASDRLILAMEGGVLAAEAVRDAAGVPGAASYTGACQVMLSAVLEAAEADEEHCRGCHGC